MLSREDMDAIASPVTANVWHFAPRPVDGIDHHDELEMYRQWFSYCDFRHLIAADVGTLQTLGQMDVLNASIVSLVLDYSRFGPLPVPSTPFTVGLFGLDHPHKRFDTILAACTKAGINCHPVIHRPSHGGRRAYNLDVVRDVYTYAHVLAHASFLDTDSLPAREAWLCGRPVLATHSDGLARVMRDGINGYWYDGSVDDLVRVIQLAYDNYDTLRAGALAARSLMPSIHDVAAQYATIWRAVLEDIVHADLQVA
jgi:glycosyltransferase involved in cell wall biosynthesis